MIIKTIDINNHSSIRFQSNFTINIKIYFDYQFKQNVVFPLDNINDIFVNHKYVKVIHARCKDPSSPYLTDLI